MDLQDQEWNGESYSPTAFVHLGKLAKRLATALRRAAAARDSTWEVAVLELTVEIEKLRNPHRVPFGDVRRKQAGARGFDHLAAVEELYAAHDELLRASQWEAIAEHHDNFGAMAEQDEQVEVDIIDSLTITSENAVQFMVAAETIVALSVDDAEPSGNATVPELTSDDVKTGQDDNDDEPLTDTQQAVYDLIKADGPITGQKICNAVGITQLSTLTGHIIPVLKERRAVQNKRGAGYYVVSVDNK